MVVLCITPVGATQDTSPVYYGLVPFGDSIEDRYNTYVLYYCESVLDTPLSNNIVPARRFIDFANEYEVEKHENLSGSAAEQLATLFPSAYMLKIGSLAYNCHSYAWHSQNYSSNKYWVFDIDPYINDNSYYEVTGSPRKGDIICYFDNNGTQNDYSDDENLHSGIVVGVVSGATSNGQCGNSNTVTVQSKWGAAGLYQHNGYVCPYTNYSDQFDGVANYVKYYRRTDHPHYHTSYSQLSSSDSLYADFHKSSCSCGQVIYEAHQIGNTPNAMNLLEEFPPNYVVPLCCIYCGYEPARLTY